MGYTSYATHWEDALRLFLWCIGSSWSNTARNALHRHKWCACRPNSENWWVLSGCVVKSSAPHAPEGAQGRRAQATLRDVEGWNRRWGKSWVGAGSGDQNVCGMAAEGTGIHTGCGEVHKVWRLACVCVCVCLGVRQHEVGPSGASYWVDEVSKSTWWRVPYRTRVCTSHERTFTQISRRGRWDEAIGTVCVNLCIFVVCDVSVGNTCPASRLVGSQRVELQQPRPH